MFKKSKKPVSYTHLDVYKRQCHTNKKRRMTHYELYGNAIKK